MSDDNAKAASNTLFVNNATAFTATLALPSIRVAPAVGAADPNHVSLVAETDHGDWPSAYDVETLEEDVAVELPALTAAHLAAGQVAILKEPGAEKAIDVGGVALAVNARGRP